VRLLQIELAVRVNGAQEPGYSDTCPLSLIPKAPPSRSRPKVGSAWILPLRQTTGLNWPTGQPGSCLPFSANPTTSPRFVITLATAFGAAQCRERTHNAVLPHERQTCGTRRPKPQCVEAAEIFEFTAALCASPTTWPLSLTPKA